MHKGKLNNTEKSLTLCNVLSPSCCSQYISVFNDEDKKKLNLVTLKKVIISQ